MSHRRVSLSQQNLTPDEIAEHWTIKQRHLRQLHEHSQALETADTAALPATCAPYNFGPALNANQTVGALVEQILQHWPGRWIDQSDPTAPHEAGRLNLAWDQAFHNLNWHPRWDFTETVKRTVTWYHQHTTGQAHPLTLTQADIRTYNANDLAPKT